MARILAASFILILAGQAGAYAQGRPDTLAMPCVTAANIVKSSGAIVLGTERMLSPDFPLTQIYLWLPGILLINGYIVWRLVRAARKDFSFEVRLWLLAAVLTLVAAVRDYLWDRGLIGGSIHYLSYTMSLLLIVFGLTLLSRVTRALTEAETLNRELEDRVAAKGQELARNYQRLQSLERERAISA